MRERIKKVIVFLAGQGMLGIALHYVGKVLPTALTENAVIGWIDDQIGLKLGLAAPDAATVASWIIPLCFAGLSLWCYHLIYARYFRKADPGGSGVQEPDKIGAIEAFNRILESSKWARKLTVNPDQLKLRDWHDDSMMPEQQIRRRLVNQLDRDLHDKLRLGELSAWGRLDRDKPLRSIPKEEWDEVAIMFDERALTSKSDNACAWTRNLQDMRKNRIRYICVQFSHKEIFDAYSVTER
jgi:hypothetical protein